MLKPLAVLAALTLATPAFAAGAVPFDTDKDGTVDMNEMKTAAGAAFDRLDPDHDGTLDAKELKGRISKKDWATADPDNDKTISRDEYLAYAESLFKAADKDSEGLLDAKELRSPTGRKLQSLLK